ncbi:alpha-(1,3)-fucosyltransferase C-like isoform X2 [Daphnia magna]|uniref:alpha-(1,3)-fucosyltransferase C-like isoform X2 n=1 Tax=Daphnia magna TaxID=35525 RepID=UPI001E1BC56D|nr:alpha-(1,3)-fucosyltransferase C-like isoform X2 [Daphnia magna]
MILIYFPKSALRAKKIFLAVSVTNISLIWLLFIHLDDLNSSTSSRMNELVNRRNKTILIWNNPEILDTSTFGEGHEPFIEHQCQVSDCIVYYNYSSLPLEDYDAILIHMHELNKTQMPTFSRRKHQRFVFLTQESPDAMTTLNVTTMGNVFNWTMSYKFNSDIQMLYGRIRPRSTAPNNPKDMLQRIRETQLPKNYAANKTRLVAWMVSHCETPGQRERYVAQLRKFIPVHIYGACGNFKCPQSSIYRFISGPECYAKLESKYKFYLSFENSICNDYVTEKFFEAMNRRLIPIVYGGANYSQFAPVHSYIDALEYSPEDLANYLKILDANDTLYNEFFWWKDHYEVESHITQMSRHSFCDLCKKLHHDEGPRHFFNGGGSRSFPTRTEVLRVFQ